MPDRLSFYLIKKIHTKTHHFLFELAAFTTISFLHNEYDQGRIHNPTIIEQHIEKFLTKHRLKNASISITLNGSYIKEQIISSPTISLGESTLYPKKQYVFDGCYLYPENDNRFVFYTCAIEHAIIMQYQLIALAKNLNMISISTCSMAHLNAYHHAHGSQFSRIQLANLLSHHTSIVPSLLSDDMLASMMHNNPSIKIPDHQKPELQIAFGAIIRNI